MKFLVFGCNGMAGHLVSVYLQEKGYEVIGFARSKSSLVKTILGDALDPKAVKSAIEIDSFDAIVNCIGHSINLRKIIKRKPSILTVFSRIIWPN